MGYSLILWGNNTNYSNLWCETLFIGNERSNKAMNETTPIHVATKRIVHKKQRFSNDLTVYLKVRPL